MSCSRPLTTSDTVSCGMEVCGLSSAFPELRLAAKGTMRKGTSRRRGLGEKASVHIDP